MTHLWRLIRLLPSYRTRILGVFAISAMIGLIGIATPFIFRHIVDALAHAEAGGRRDDLAARMAAATGLFIALRVALVVLGTVQHQQSSRLWLDNVGSLRQRVFDGMSALSLHHYETARIGDIMDRFSNIVPITAWMREMVEGTLAAILQIAFSLAILLFVSPVAGAIMLIAIPANIVLSVRSMRATKPHRQRWQRLGGRMSAILNEMMSQITVVRAFGAEPVLRRRFGFAHSHWRDARNDEWRIDRNWTMLILMVNGVALSLVALAVVHAALSGRHSLGDILLVFTLSHALVGFVQPVSKAINAAGEAEIHAQSLTDLLDRALGAPEVEGTAVLDRISEIRFEDVTFFYPGEQKPVLQDVSFTVAAHTAVALVGPSGSGKSSLVKLLLRLYEPTSGRIFVNGRDIRDYDPMALRARIGVVLQDVALFNDTIGNNIAFAREDEPEGRIREAARIAQADSFITRLPEGYDTPVGERGIKLSGGERQRIAVARAVLRNPDIVVLDEATSALDVESERLVQKALDGLMEGRTSIAIAHRLSTVRDADMILVFKEGRIVERGTHDQLLGQDGLYRQLHAIQFELAA